MTKVRRFFFGFIYPRSEDQDLKRQEFIFNILIVALILLMVVAIISSTIAHLLANEQAVENNALSFVALFLFLFFLSFLYFLSRKGFFRSASYIFLGIFFLFASYMSYRWGVDVSVGLLFYTLTIVMSGILISTRFAFLMTLITSLTIGSILYLHTIHFAEPNRYWTTELWRLTDVIVVSILFLIIATVSWLSNREIEKSLMRARKSEADLKVERDSLEIKVEERTKELKEVQAEKMTQLYRFAEFGRISSGLFHDLINPLNAVSLNLGKTDGTKEETMQYVNNAVRAAKKLEDLVAAVRKQLVREETRALFSVDEEIRNVIDVLSHKAQKANVELRFTPRLTLKRSTEEIHIFGDAVKFNQVVLNLVANGIDACIEVAPVGIPSRWVEVMVVLEPELVAMSVEDNGVGIPEHHMDKIFEPFFTTKVDGQGIGIGLSIVKRIVEKDFGGLLLVESNFGEGSKFKTHLPTRKHTIEYA